MNEREEIRKESAHGTSGEEPEEKRPQVGEGGGSSMGAAPREERLRATLAAAYPALEPSEALRRRVAGLAAQQEAREPQRTGDSASLGRRWTPLRLGLGLALATALLAAVVGRAPTVTATQLLQRAEAAVTQVRSAHFVRWRVAADGSRTKVGETWYQAGRWRLESPNEIQIYADGTLWSYEPRLSKVSLFRKKEGPFGFNPSGFSLAAMVRDYARWGWKDKIRRLDDTTIGGRPAHRVVIERAGEPERSLLLVDAVTDLPIQGEQQLATAGQWVTQVILEQRYNEPLPAQLFVPEFPKSARLFDVDAGRQRWERRLAKGLARRRVGDRTIVIRDLQVNAAGDVFLLYTAGSRPGDRWQDWSIGVRDETGTHYLPSEGFQPYLEGGPADWWHGFVFQGAKLEGGWWVPAEPQSSWKPRRFTLTFHVHPIAHHGKDPVPDENFSAGSSFILIVERPAAPLLPEYMPSMAMGGLQPGDLMRSRAMARAQYYRYQERDLPRALALYREILRLRDERTQQIGEPILDAQAWLDLGEVLREMGRNQEALEALEQALREAIYPDSMQAEVRRALDSLRSEIAWSPGRPAPGFTATDVEGQPQSLDRYRGQVLLIDFWSTWDTPPLVELPRLKALYERYHPQSFAILGVGMNVDLDRDDPQAFRRIAQQRQILWPQLFDGRGWEGQAAQLFGVRHTPSNILLDRRGVVHAVNLRGPALEKAVVELMQAAQ
jgi:outer membrane lipoprotein-sorting protein/peroxiredoxin